MRQKLRFLIALACLCGMGAGPAFTEEGDQVYRKPELVNAIGFKASLANGKVVCSWKKYLRDDLQFYKVVRSDSNPNPVYPDDGYVFYTEEAGITSYDDPAPKAGTWYYRLTIVTTGGDRWVSPVVKIVVPPKGSQVPGPKDFAP